LLPTIIIEYLHFRDVRGHHHRNIATSQIKPEAKSLCVLKNFIVNDGDLETLSVSRGVRGEGHKWIVGRGEFNIVCSTIYN
jgi:hypothetical protein